MAFDMMDGISMLKDPTTGKVCFDMMDGISMLKDPTTGKKNMFACKLMRWNTRSRYYDMPIFSIHSKGNKKILHQKSD